MLCRQFGVTRARLKPSLGRLCPRGRGSRRLLRCRDRGCAPRRAASLRHGGPKCRGSGLPACRPCSPRRSPRHRRPCRRPRHRRRRARAVVHRRCTGVGPRRCLLRSRRRRLSSRRRCRLRRRRPCGPAGSRPRRRRRLRRGRSSSSPRLEPRRRRRTRPGRFSGRTSVLVRWRSTRTARSCPSPGAKRRPCGTSSARESVPAS